MLRIGGIDVSNRFIKSIFTIFCSSGILKDLSFLRLQIVLISEAHLEVLMLVDSRDMDIHSLRQHFLHYIKCWG